MPVEIKELVIRATITPAGQAAPPAGNTDEKKLQQIADEILKKIKQKNER